MLTEYPYNRYYPKAGEIVQHIDGRLGVACKRGYMDMENDVYVFTDIKEAAFRWRAYEIKKYEGKVPPAIKKLKKRFHEIHGGK